MPRSRAGSVNRIGRGFRLMRASWQVLKADRELILLPVLAFMAIAAAAASLFALASAVGPGTGRSAVPRLAFIFVFLFATHFIGIFANAAVVGAATIRLAGGDPTVGDGLRLATSRAGKIAGWAVIAATVGLVLRAIEQRAGFVGRIVISFAGATWSVVTFFVVPVLLYEPLDVRDSIKRSGHLFTERWGEQFTGTASIGLAMAVMMVPAIALGVLLVDLQPLLGLMALVAAIGLLGAAGSAMSGIFSAALYHYATTGRLPGAFTEDDLRGSFRPRRRSIL